jgi:hypothetical protein
MRADVYTRLRFLIAVRSFRLVVERAALGELRYMVAEEFGNRSAGRATNAESEIAQYFDEGTRLSSESADECAKFPAPQLQICAVRADELPLTMLWI